MCFLRHLRDTRLSEMKQSSSEAHLEGDGQCEEGALKKLSSHVDSLRHVEDILIVIAVVLMSIGFAVMCMGYIIPRGYTFDPTLPAREMESIEMHYARLAYYLDVCVVVGMGFIAAGGVVASSVSVYHFITSRKRVYRQADRRDMALLDASTTSYGTDKTR